VEAPVVQIPQGRENVLTRNAAIGPRVTLADGPKTSTVGEHPTVMPRVCQVLYEIGRVKESRGTSPKTPTAAGAAS
jgi:hypothetical protein